MKITGYMEIVTPLQNINSTDYFTVARVVEDNYCAELHVNKGEAIVEFSYKISDFAWEFEDVITVNWFSTELSDTEVLQWLDSEFEKFYGEVVNFTEEDD